MKPGNCCETSNKKHSNGGIFWIIQKFLLIIIGQSERSDWPEQNEKLVGVREVWNDLNKQPIYLRLFKLEDTVGEVASPT
jgi:hypothetical protein